MSKGKRILVVGSGGREHALAWKIARSALADAVVVAPGNAGTAMEPKIENVAIEACDIDGLVAFARSAHIDLAVIGPEAPLVAGITDRFEAAGLRCFGPKAQAARLEGSKRFSKEFMQRYGIPTPAYAAFTELDSALAHVRRQAMPIVIKADGLAAGKGVIVAQTIDEAERALRWMLEGGAFGSAGEEVVIEEFLEGEEASFIALVDGSTLLPLATSQDHKARDDGDRGPNTGGMGAYSPAPIVTDSLQHRIVDEIMQPVVDGMRKEGCPYTGFLYAGLMISAAGDPRVLEFNCRFGDPETQPIMLRMQSDLMPLIDAAMAGNLQRCTVEWDPRVALGVVVAAAGYPEHYSKGEVISCPREAPEGLKVFHAGTRLEGESIVTSGGRVLCATALGATTAEAQQRAYALVDQVSWAGSYHRTDIGYRAVAREAAEQRECTGRPERPPVPEFPDQA